MLQLESELNQQRMRPSIKTAVMAIGGAEDKIRGRQILHSFFDRAGSTKARILIIPSASREPEVMGRIYRDIFKDMGALSVEFLSISDRQQGEDPKLCDCLDQFTGVFMSGGDQIRLCDLLAETPLMEKLRSLVQQGQLTLAGTSAGAAALGQQMITGGGSGEPPSRDLVDLGIGLGMIPQVIVDQHFHNRNRLARLISAIAANPDKLGIGIDEDTCALFERDGLIQILGRGTVTIVDPRQSTYTNYAQVGASDPLSISNLRLHLLSHGDCYDLHKCKVRSKRVNLPPI